MIASPPASPCRCVLVEVDQPAFDADRSIVVTCLRCGRRWDSYAAWYGRNKVPVAA